MEAKLLTPSSHALLSNLSSNYRRKTCYVFPNTRKSSAFVPLFSSLSRRSIVSLPLQASSSFVGMEKRKRVDVSENLTLENIRSSLILQEDSIIYGLLERSQYCYNADTYDPDAFPLDGFHGSLVEYMLRETERLHATIGRYQSPDEHPFFPDGLPETVLPPLQYPKVLSRRIHYGKYVAEAKFRASPDVYEEAIKAQDSDKLMELLTYSKVEEAIMKRVEVKTLTFGQHITVIRDGHEDEPAYKIDPSLVAKLYGDWIMPLTKEVQVEYLLRRLD